MKKKLYRAKSLSGAQARVRQLEKQVAECHALLDDFDVDRKLMAMLAAETRQFFNPLHAIEAKRRRDEILKMPDLRPSVFISG